ncbi:hypothetical protein [Effusibacillus dendaii]|uniref:Uncharacterized protein n=1 Tax=Effusibacillus dendaii TaxID=2743772 RepID=A0A7I8DJY3_9BACL|nr:hypothetical protein [Effusibacillus dendaii]BCJ88191.1 hypothetical protein skT53_31760 [Effusibacillus dendaii]
MKKSVNTRVKKKCDVITTNVVIPKKKKKRVNAKISDDLRIKLIKSSKDSISFVVLEAGNINGQFTIDSISFSDPADIPTDLIINASSVSPILTELINRGFGISAFISNPPTVVFVLEKAIS